VLRQSLINLIINITIRHKDVNHEITQIVLQVLYHLANQFKTSKIYKMNLLTLIRILLDYLLNYSLHGHNLYHYNVIIDAILSRCCSQCVVASIHRICPANLVKHVKNACNPTTVELHLQSKFIQLKTRPSHEE
jgi:hypothetical protein